jgi:hypothetical protein
MVGVGVDGGQQGDEHHEVYNPLEYSILAPPGLEVEYEVRENGQCKEPLNASQSAQQHCLAVRIVVKTYIYNQCG